MAQYLKDEIQQEISRAALEVFAKKGFLGATVAEIAKAAKISTGNVYRYYENKEVLFDEVLPDSFVERLEALLRQRVEALRGVQNVQSLAPEAPYHLISEELLRFSIDNRLRVAILLSRSQGTRRERFSQDLAKRLVQLALSHFESVGAPPATQTQRFLLHRIYQNFVQNLAEILWSFPEEQTLRQAVHEYTKYHLTGLRALFS